MTLAINELAPDFTVGTTEGEMRFHDWVGDSWAVLFSHPKDFTPVCTTELGYMARKSSPNSTSAASRSSASASIRSTSTRAGRRTSPKPRAIAPNFPMIGDTDYAVSKLYDMLPAACWRSRRRTAADNQTVRNVFVIGPDKKIKLVISYPMTTGRNFDEMLRVIDSLQLTAKHRVATPVNWKQGEDVIIAGSVSDDEARQLYPEGWKAPKPYIRIVPQPDLAGTARTARAASVHVCRPKSGT
jgi:alkyl hydroperoxide reductase subunit AhpC